MTGPSDRPVGELTAPRPVLVFDGDCAFCTSSARRGQRWLGLEHVEPWQFLDLEELGLTEAECNEAVQWVAADGSVVAAERAVGAALVHAGGVWRWIGRLLLAPGVVWIAGVVYRWVARNRSRLPGGTPACSIDRS